MAAAYHSIRRFFRNGGNYILINNLSLAGFGVVVVKKAKRKKPSHATNIKNVGYGSLGFRFLGFHRGSKHL
jgi:hypothetical protein